MSSTEIIFSPSAERELKKLSKDKQKAVLKTLKVLQDGLSTLEIEKIKGHPRFFRVKAGQDMRIIYHPMTTSRVVILVIRDRKSAYRGLDSLGHKLEATLHSMERSARVALGLPR